MKLLAVLSLGIDTQAKGGLKQGDIALLCLRFEQLLKFAVALFFKIFDRDKA